VIVIKEKSALTTAMELKIFLNIYLSSDWERQGPWAI
jgi:hypothetical protein